MAILSLEFFLKYERVSTPINLANEAIDNLLAKRLTRLCGSEKKLVVGSAEHKRIIEKNLGITCLYVDVPDCEVTICSMKNPPRALLPEEKSETCKRNYLPIGKELITFLCQHDIDVKPEMVNKTIVELAHLLHGTELREMEHLKFLRILLKDFMVISGIGTKNWSLIELATILKMICHRGSTYEVHHPVEIFSHDEYRMIEFNASRYKTSFSNIDVLSVYEDVVSLNSDKYILLCKLDYLVKKAIELPEKAEVIILPTGSKVGKESSTDVDDRLNSITKYNCNEVTLVKGKLDFSCESPRQDVKEILTILDEDPSMEKPNSNEEICKEDDQCLIPDEVQEELTENNTDENKQARDIGVQTMDDDGRKLTANKPDEEFHATSKRLNSRTGKQNEVVPATRARPKSEPQKVLQESEEKEANTKSWVMSFRWQMSKRDISLARSRSPSAGLSFPAKKSHRKTDRRSKAMKQTCMRFICYCSVQCWFECAC